MRIDVSMLAHRLEADNKYRAASAPVVLLSALGYAWAQFIAFIHHSSAWGSARDDTGIRFAVASSDAVPRQQATVMLRCGEPLPTLGGVELIWRTTTSSWIAVAAHAHENATTPVIQGPPTTSPPSPALRGL